MSAQVILFDAPGHDVEAITPAGTMWFPSRDDADYELALMFPKVNIEVRREPAPR